jgi:hypothetical protein
MTPVGSESPRNEGKVAPTSEPEQQRADSGEAPASGDAASAPGPAAPSPMSCALAITPAGALSVELHNRGAEAIEASYYYPLTFSLEAWSGPTRVEIQEPAYDGPVEPRSITVPAGQRVTIPTPITLLFAPDRRPRSDSTFEWLLLSPPRDLLLRARRVLISAPDLTCELQLHPSP